MRPFNRKLLLWSGMAIFIVSLIILRGSYTSNCQPKREDRLLIVRSYLNHPYSKIRHFIITSLLGYPDGGYHLTDLRGCRIDLTSIPMDGIPVWSPTGKWVAFSSYRGKEENILERDEWSIYVLDIDAMSHQEYQLPKLDYAGGLVWSTDEKYLLFQWFDIGSDRMAIGRLNRQTGQFEQFPYITERGNRQLWAPDREHLAVLTDREPECHDLYIYHIDGTSKRLLYKDGDCTQYPFLLEWSPDGQVVAFALSPEQDLSGKLCWIWVADGKTECIWGITVGTAAWSPNSHQLAFSSSGLKIFDMETQEIKMLFEYEEPFTILDIDWSSDGEYIAYALCDTETIEFKCAVHYLYVDDGKHWRLTNYFVRDDEPMWAPVNN